MNRALFKWGVAGLLLAYPFVVYWAHARIAPGHLLAILLLLLALRQMLIMRLGASRAWWHYVVTGVLLLAAAGLLVWRHDASFSWVRAYPLVLDLLVLSVFFFSFFTRRPLVERFARWSVQGDLPAAAIAYTHRVNWLWVIVMAGISLGAAYTLAYTSLAVWSLFNGFIAYVIMGVTFGLEYLVRMRLRRKWGLS